jgi:hypothetical protein
MYRAIPSRLWEKPLDFSLQATSEGELQMPFSRFVRPTERTKTPDVTFAKFLQLPTELQFRIIGFCDASTLYQLMHTSRHTRPEAQKLFVANPDAWYCVDANWISRGCYPGDAPYDMQFFPLVEQLEVQFRRMDAEYWLLDYNVTGEADQDEEELMSEEDDRATERLEVCLKDFWLRLHNQFPRVTRVVIQCSDCLRPPSVLPPEIFKKVAVMCNRSTEVILSLLDVPNRRDRRAQRRVWCRDPKNRTIGSAINWKEYTTQLHPRIMLPKKMFQGPIGAYEYYAYKREQYCAFQYTKTVRLIAAVENDHFVTRYSPLQCLAPYCSVWFNQAGEYTCHMIKYNNHQEFIVIPKQYTTLFADADTKLAMLERGYIAAWEAMRAEWGDDGTERRKATVAAAVQQVANDPQYASKKPGHDSYIINRVLTLLDGDG